MELSGLSWTVLTILSALPLLYWYFTRKFNFWRKQGLSGPKPLPIIGNSLDTFFTPMPVVELDWYKRFGRLYGIYSKEKPVLTVGEPELIKQILVKDFHLFSDRKVRRVNHKILGQHLFNSTGDDWKRLRSIMSPTFTSGKMKKMYPMIRECLKEFIDTLEVPASKRANINLKDMHGNFTMDVIATCAFATKTNSHKEADNPFIVNAKKVFEFSFRKMLTILLLPEAVIKLLGIQSVVDESSNEFFMNLTSHIIKQRKLNKDGKNFNDFIQLLVDAEKGKEELHDDNDVNEAHHVNDGKEELEIEKKILSSNFASKTLTEEEIMAQGWLFFIAGYETTATTLTFCSYELALHPKTQEKLYEEIEGAVDAKGEISYETLAKLPYLDAVLSETLRLYPPVIRLERRCLTDDYKLGNTGLVLHRNQEIDIPVFAIQRSEEFYSEPDKFYPDRFLPENRENVKPYTYLPFGAGPRNCIGMRFALMEAKLGLAQIVRRFRFFRTSETAVPLEFKTITRLTAAKSVVVGIEKRE